MHIVSLGESTKGIGMLTEAAVLALAMSCAPGVDPQMLAGIAKHESGLRADAVHLNTNGTRDVGLMQINERNFQWLGLTEATALDPCESLRAARDLLQSYSRYNTGSPTRGFANGYVRNAMASIASVHPPAATRIKASARRLKDQLISLK